jgi:cbb3-type cytochrome oxidase maturation protein
MEVIVVLIGISLIVALIFLGAFIWSVKSGQYDDTYTPSVRMLFDKKTKTEKRKNDSQPDESNPSVK